MIKKLLLLVLVGSMINAGEEGGSAFRKVVGMTKGSAVSYSDKFMSDMKKPPFSFIGVPICCCALIVVIAWGTLKSLSHIDQ